MQTNNEKTQYTTTSSILLYFLCIFVSLALIFFSLVGLIKDKQVFQGHVHGHKQFRIRDFFLSGAGSRVYLSEPWIYYAPIVKLFAHLLFLSLDLCAFYLFDVHTHGLGGIMRCLRRLVETMCRKTDYNDDDNNNNQA